MTLSSQTIGQPKAKQNFVTIHAGQIQCPLQKVLPGSTKILTRQPPPPQQRPKCSLDILLADKHSVSLLASLTTYYAPRTETK